MQAKFRIGKTTYQFKEIDLKTYYKLQEILNSPKKGTEYEIVEAVTDCPVKELKKLKYQDWILVWEECNVHITDLQGTTDAIRPVIEWKGKKYALPKIEDITVGEFADLDTIITSQGAEKKLAEIAAVLYRPVIRQTAWSIKIADYDSEGYEERLALFQDLPLAYIKSANSFFLQSANSSLKNTVESLLKLPEMKMLDPQGQELVKQFLQPDPGGEYSTYWPERILSDFKKLRSLRLEKRSTGWRGSVTRFGKAIWPFKRSKNIV
jgi:hypothetical protein